MIVRRAATLALVALLMLPVAASQAGTLSNPVQGAFQDVYVISGRIIDTNGNPAAGARVTITLDQPGVTAKPLLASADCFGTFIAYFTLKRVDPKGTISVALAIESRVLAFQKAELDPFFRRTDMVMRTSEPWGSRCPEQTDLWPTRISVSGRILNRTEEYESDGVKYQATPYLGNVRFRYWENEDIGHCPPSPEGRGLCDQHAGNVDERGDFRYSWTFEGPVNPYGWVEVIAADRSWNVTVDRDYRIAVHHIEATGQGIPRDTPTPGLALIALTVALVALASRSLLAPRRGR